MKSMISWWCNGICSQHQPTGLKVSSIGGHYALNTWGPQSARSWYLEGCFPLEIPEHLGWSTMKHHEAPMFDQKLIICDALNWVLRQQSSFGSARPSCKFADSVDPKPDHGTFQQNGLEDDLQMTFKNIQEIQGPWPLSVGFHFFICQLHLIYPDIISPFCHPLSHVSITDGLEMFWDVSVCVSGWSQLIRSLANQRHGALRTASHHPAGHGAVVLLAGNLAIGGTDGRGHHFSKWQMAIFQENTRDELMKPKQIGWWSKN